MKITEKLATARATTNNRQLIPNQIRTVPRRKTVAVSSVGVVWPPPYGILMLGYDAWDIVEEPNVAMPIMAGENNSSHLDLCSSFDSGL